MDKVTNRIENEADIKIIMVLYPDGASVPYTYVYNVYPIIPMVNKIKTIDKKTLIRNGLLEKENIALKANFNKFKYE